MGAFIGPNLHFLIRSNNDGKREAAFLYLAVVLYPDGSVRATTFPSSWIILVVEPGKTYRNIPVPVLLHVPKNKAAFFSWFHVDISNLLYLMIIKFQICPWEKDLKCPTA